jgi:hypothetical protein
VCVNVGFGQCCHDVRSPLVLLDDGKFLAVARKADPASWGRHTWVGEKGAPRKALNV